MNKSVVRVFVFSIIVVLIGVLYFEIVLPFLNLMNNEVKSQGNHGPIVDNNGVFDKDFFRTERQTLRRQRPSPANREPFTR